MEKEASAQMRVDAGLGWDLESVGEQARKLEAAGFAAVQAAETAHDPFLPLAQAALHTSSIELRTSIAVAFGRTPMALAYISNDLNIVSKGRFTLGLGSQIKPHITKRYSMPWSNPAARMREFILALRAIWSSWHDGARLDFRGDFYTHTLMTPFFSPGASSFGPPKVALAAVGPRMTEVAAEVADVLLVHAFTTETYVRETTLPALQRGWERAGKSRDDFEISIPVFVVAADNETELEQVKAGVKQQLAFYGSTPAYRIVLESVGAGALQPELNALSKRGKWREMGDLFSDDLLDEFAIVAEPSQIGQRLRERFGDIADRTALGSTGHSENMASRVLEQLRS